MLLFLLSVVQVFTVPIPVCVSDAVRKHTVFNGNPLPSRIFLTECVGGCCADLRDRQTGEREGGREGEE